MRGDRVTIPKISTATLRYFSRYAEWFVKRNVHSVRILRHGFDISSAQGPLIICLNHPSWWDPLIALLLAVHLMPHRRHYAPIEATALSRYRLFERIGFFGLEIGSASGAAQFLRTGRAILTQPDAALWVTAQGEFADVRKRPLLLRSGVAHLAAHVPAVKVVPLALEYVFWEERFPEALCAFGSPLSPAGEPADGLAAAITGALESSMDVLSQASIERDREQFAILLGGRAGVGGIYDLWRRLSSRLRGESFRSEHGTERI